MQVKYVLICVVILLFISILVCLNFIYDPFCGERCDYRKAAYYTPGLLKFNLSNRQEPGFKLGPVLNKQASGKILSYSLYGTDPKYYNYMVSNIKTAKEKLSDWTTRVYLHDKVPELWRDKLVSAGAEVQLVNDPVIKPGNSAGMFWRFLPLTENCHAVILDADDQLSSSDISKARSLDGQNTHVMSALSGPMWPVQHITGKRIFKSSGFVSPVTRSRIQNYPHRSTFGSDEVFLTTEVYDSAKAQGLKHSVLPFNVPFRRKLNI